MRTIMKRVLSIVLACTILIGSVPVSAFAADPIEGNAPSSTITEVEGQTPQEDSDDADTPQESPAPSEGTPDSTETPVSTEETPTATEESVADAEQTSESTDETASSADAGIAVIADDLVDDVDVTKSTAQETSTQVVETPVSYTTKASDGGTILDAAIFCSDVHGSTSDLSSVMKGVKTSGVDYSSIGFVGDTCLTVANTTSTVQSALGDTSIAVMFSYAASHDTEDGADISTNWNYSGEVEGISDDYLVYTIRETDMQNNTTAETDFTTWYNSLTDAEKKLPIFIMSHRPLHARRSDNANAADWYDAISAAAESSDIAFFWGHNHTGETDVDTAAYYVAKDGTESFTVYKGSTVVPNFTYMNAGYINANNQDPARINVATTVQITADNLIFQDYTTSGEYTNSSYSHNVTVAREFASATTEPVVTLESIALSGNRAYRIGDELALTVTATYSDGTTADVTADATLSGHNMGVGGNYTVTATYEDKTATINITVNPMTVTEWDDTDQVSVQATADNISGLTVTNVYGTPDLSGVFADYMSVSVTPAGITEGAEVVYSMLVFDEIPTDGIVLYHVSADGKTLTPISYTLTTSESGGNYLNFTTDLTGIFAYGLVVVPDGYALSKIEVSNVVKTEYFVGDSLDMVSPVVTATYIKEGAEDFTRILYIKDDYATTDGYTISGYNMVKPGAQTVTITYENCTTSFDINVWGETFTDETTGVVVTVGAEEYGVSTATVTESVNENIADAVADVIKGDNYKAYDITLNFTEGYETNTAEKTVTLPIPDGVTNPAVYYVSDDGETVEKMPTTLSEDGKTVTFKTTHFSTYVIGESTEITVPDAETATGSGTTTTTEEKEVYVLVSTPTAGEQYIIVNRNSAGSGYALKENTTTGASITVNAAGNGISAPYIETTDETIMWNTASGMTFQSENGGYYLRYNDGLNFSTRYSTNWTYSSNTLYYRYSSSRNYYLYNSSGTWTASRYSSDEVYFYEKQTVETETTTTVSGTYSIAGNPAEVTKVVTAGSTATLGSTLTFTPTSGSATTTENPTDVTYTVVEGGDPKGVIAGINGNTVTFSGNYGKALVKVSYETDFGTVTNYIIVNASEPTYVLDITSGDAVVTGTTITQKNVTSSTTLQLGTQIQFVDEDGAEIVDLPEGATIEWHIPEEYHSVAEVDHETGLVSFKGVNGAFYVTATLTVNGKDYTVGVNISATTSRYSVPTDGTKDFPEYPNEGAIRFDKTATAVGNFSETGLTQIELSMTGVPYTTGSEIDVVLMLDMTGSMDDVTSNTSEPTGYVRIDATIAASKAFIETIVKKEDGSYNGNRVGVYVFNKNGAATLYDFGTVDSDTELNAIEADLDSIYDDHYASGGTPYDDGLAKCQEVLAAAKTDGIGNNRQQFTVFMTDGVPTSYAYVNGTSYGTHSSASDIAGMLTSASNYAIRDTDYKYEYYSTEMKKAGVTVYTVGVGLENENNAWSGSATQCLNLASALLNDISGPAGETTQPDAVGASTLSKKDSYFFSVEDATAATDMEKVFSNIAQKILQAATDVTVEDKITDEYTMVFDIPTGSKAITGLDSQEFYIEFVKYTLDENHERTDSGTSITKLYLENTNGVYSAASDSEGTDYEAPVFESKVIGEKGTLYYWTTDSSYASKAAVSYSDGTNTYYFYPYGMEENEDGTAPSGWYNMTSGAYAYGTVDSTTNMSENLVIATPYFVYNAASKVIYWTVDKLDDEEYALRYFLYLNNSATEVGTGNEVDPGSYLTNEYAFLTYTNFNGNECRQEFPKPQLTWSGAQVSYVFYLVNAAGQPINKSGQVVDFANATFITDVYTESTVWNKGEDGQITADSKLSIEWLANELLPSDYKVYDEQASYKLHVYGDHTGESIFDYFTIGGSSADAISSSLNNRLELTTTATTVSVNTTKVYNTKAGEKIAGYGTYTSEATTSIDDEIVLSNFDFYNTTVAFAVVWQPRLVEDTVVVDYGLDVLINVVQNDILQNTVSGIGAGNSAYGSIAMNTGVSTDAKLGTAALNIDGNTISIENENAIRFHQGDMLFNEPVKFYYETPVEFYENSNHKEGYMYSSVTVIPATTVYYEDTFVNFTSYTNNVKDEKIAWTTDGTAVNATQAQDRPGESQISASLDADNNYGYDKAYADMSTYSLGSAHMITVDSSKRGEATFTFYGTGFDVIGLTSNTTGTLIVQVYSGSSASGTPVKSTVVDTYYGYTYENGKWILSNETENTLYQVPVIKIADLEYGQYTAKIIAGYNEYFDHTATSGKYDLYIDAIRIYDPTGNLNDTANEAYVKDGEGWPEYSELRNQIIDEGTFNALEGDTSVSGVVFIDGDAEVGNAQISDYTNYGPNNELYLATGQAVAFDLNATAKAGEVSKVQIAIKTVGGTGSVEVYGVDANGNITECIDGTISTATDMYYDITELNGKTVVIRNTGSESDAIVSITNVKTTYTKAQTEEDTPAVAMFSIRRSTANLALATLNAEEDDAVTDTPIVDDTVTDTPTGGNTSTDTDTTDKPVVEDTVIDSETDKPVVDDTVKDEDITDKPVVDDNVTDTPDTDDTTSDSTGSESFITIIINAIIAFISKLFGFYGGLFN